MLYAGVLGISSGIAFSRGFTAITVGAAALVAAAWAAGLGFFAGRGFPYAVREAMLLTWPLESGLFFGLLLNRLVVHQEGGTAIAAQPTALPDEAHSRGS
jgi:hypothetical protein